MDARQGEISIEVTGEDLTDLDNEPGGHRIQRVPPTERKGRVHTSTVTVAVLDKQQVHLIEFNEHDFRVEWYSGTGAGGQHRNKHQNSCRITHLATGVIATAQCRARENSLNEAKTAILERLNNHSKKNFNDARAQDRKLQVGSGERGDKIRTYRFQDNSVKDHRTGRTGQCDKLMNGFFEVMWR